MSDLQPAAEEPCSNCPFRAHGGIRATPETGRHLIQLACYEDVSQHPCHQTVLSGPPRACRGAALFRQQFMGGAVPPGVIFEWPSEMLREQTLGASDGEREQ